MSNKEALEKFSNRKWRLNNLYYIEDKKGDVVLFVMNEQQEDLYDNLHFNNLILKARQLGFSTFIDILILDACLFNSNVSAGIIADNLDNAKSLLKRKVKFPYDKLPEKIKEHITVVEDNKESISFSNGSSIEVGTSIRSGTKQWLHISEFGKICAKYPDKAKEVVTGSLNAVGQGCMVFIESTAEGQEGYFYEYAQESRNIMLEGKELSKMDYKFFFYPWWENPEYSLDDLSLVIDDKSKQYFDATVRKVREELGVMLDLTDGQKRWWISKKKVNGDDQGREYPSYPSEAFEQAIDGSYFAQQMAKVRERGQILTIPVQPELKVNTFWDLGRSKEEDSMALWLHQQYGLEHRFIKYYSNTGESLQHYARWLDDWARDNNVLFGRHFLPHDSSVVELTRDDGKSRLQILDEMLQGEVVRVKRVKEKAFAVQKARELIPNCWFEEVETHQGVKCLDNYRKEWNDKLGIYKDKARHDWASHGADAFMTFATGWEEEDDSMSAPLTYSNSGYF